MDANELKDALEHAGKAFVKGLVASESERREEDEAQLVADLRVFALKRIREALVSERRANREKAVSAVSSYCSKARADALDQLRNDKRMPRSINYLERYNALLKMEDRAEVLRRLDQTLAKAEVIIAEAGEVDIDAALIEAAQVYAEKVQRLDGITVSPAEEQVADETGAAPKTSAGRKDDSEIDLDAVIEDAFGASFGVATAAEAKRLEQAADWSARIELLAKQIAEGAAAAEEAAKAKMRSDAESVAGNVLRLPVSPGFDGGAVLSAEMDVDELRDLAGEVRTSFRTFKQVVQDNGLFAAFASEGTYGACKGWRFGFWWDDFLYDLSEYEGDIPGRNPVKDIPCDIDEDEGGDSLSKSIERMREFNKKRYWGKLDDDFDEHVEAFWYGFKKLMEGVNGLYRMNPAAFNQYCNDVADGAKQATLDVGAGYMDAHQAEEFCKEVGKREKG